MVRIRPLFAWYDLWVGFYWDGINRRLYFLPVPMFGIVVDFGRKEIDDDDYERGGV